MKKSLGSLCAWLVAPLACSNQSIAEPGAGSCGIPDDYLEVRGTLMDSIGELADQEGTSLTDLGPVLVRVTLAPECDDQSLNQSNSCMHMERTSGSVDDATAAFERAMRDYPDQIVSVGWAISNELGPGRLPIFAGMLFAPGYRVYGFSGSQESCDA